MTATQSTLTEDDLPLGHAAMSPEVRVSGSPLPGEAEAVLTRVVVDLHVTLPSTFELTFLDANLDVLDSAGIKLGTAIQVLGGVLSEPSARTLVDGEVTAIQGAYGGRYAETVVRGCSVEHRLQRAPRTRTFVDAKDSDLARQLASDAGVPVGTIDATAQVHPQLGQDNQTDWAFLRDRADEIGYEVGTADGKLYFRKATTVSDATSVPAMAGANLVAFEPRVSSAGLAPEVEVRAWDPVSAKAVSVKKPVTAAYVSIGAGDAAEAARLFTTPGAPAAAGSGELGPAPSTQAHVSWDRAVTVDNNSTEALSEAATALAEQMASGFAEAEGELLGDARVVAGAVLEVDGVPAMFKGKWTVSRARHVFDHNVGFGYRTWFAVSGRQDRSLLSLAASDSNGPRRGTTRIPGVVGGVVTSLDDPLGLGRVKVALPWLSPEYEGSWAPVTQLSAGKATGAMFLPEPGDQVLVAFEFGDLRRPYVLGSVVNSRTGSGGVVEPGGDQPGKAAVKEGTPSSVVRRGFLSPGGNRLVFYDDCPPGGGKPTASQVILATAEDKIGLVLDQVGGTLTLSCKPGSPPGRIVLECDGDVEINAGDAGNLTINGGTNLSLKGQQVAIEATTTLDLKGATVNVEGSGPVAVKGKPIQLN